MKPTFSSFQNRSRSIVYRIESTKSRARNYDFFFQEVSAAQVALAGLADVPALESSTCKEMVSRPKQGDICLLKTSKHQYLVHVHVQHA